MSRKARSVLRILGGIMIVVGILSAAYNLHILALEPSGLLDGRAHPHVFRAFRVMGGITMACHLFLIYLGAEFLRLNRSRLPVFVSLMAIEILYVVAASLACLLPGIGPSLAAAFGLANGGLMIQFLVLLPLWGPILAVWAFGQLDPPPAGMEITG